MFSFGIREIILIAVIIGIVAVIRVFRKGGGQKSNQLGGQIKSLFRMLGLFALLAGLATAIYYFVFFDTSIAVPGGDLIGIARVNNIGLMQQRQNGIIFGFAGAAFGLVFVFLGRDKTVGIGASERRCPYCKEAILRDAIICRHCGKDVNPV